MIEVAASYSSFSATIDMCRAATVGQDIAHAEIMGRHVFAAPGDSPHRLYSVYFDDMLAAGFRQGQQ